MSQMMQIDQVCKLIDRYVEQLKGLAYSKNAAMATRLQGAIDGAILIAGVSADRWAREVTIALNDVMANRPEPASLPNNLPEALANAVTLPTPVQLQQPSPVHVVPLPRL